jgi:hypothetical protein
MGTFCQFVIYVGNIIDRTVSMISECSIKQDLDKSLYFGIRFQNTAGAVIKVDTDLEESLPREHHSHRRVQSPGTMVAKKRSRLSCPSGFPFKVEIKIDN